MAAAASSSSLVGFCKLSSKLEVGSDGNLLMRLMLQNVDCMSMFEARSIQRFWNQSLEILKEVWGKALTSFSPARHFFISDIKIKCTYQCEENI